RRRREVGDLHGRLLDRDAEVVGEGLDAARLGVAVDARGGEVAVGEIEQGEDLGLVLLVTGDRRRLGHLSAEVGERREAVARLDGEGRGLTLLLELARLVALGLAGAGGERADEREAREAGGEPAGGA